jgi:hypothetical protein
LFSRLIKRKPFWIHQSQKNMLIMQPLPFKNAYMKACDESLEVSCLMLVCIEPDLQKQFQDQEGYDMIVALKDIF